MREFTSYFDYQHFDAVVPALQGGIESERHRVVIVGGGPIGFTMALGLAHLGIASVVIESDDSVCTGSRAGCITRRTLEVFERFGAAAPMMRQGLPWSEGWSYHRTSEVFHLDLKEDRFSQYPAMLNIQQCYVEQYLLDAMARYPGLIDVRWQNRVTAVKADDIGVELEIATPKTTYRLTSDWIVACDGAHSSVRKALGLRYSGTQYESRYVIVDIKMKSDLAPGRRAWFDPPSNPGCTLLMHRHRDDLWRLDYQLRDDEDETEAAKPENVLARVADHLDLIGETSDWKPVWISTYKASSLTLDRYRHGRVLFAGDAAHLVPIFGVRGMNSGIDDTNNLAWKLASVLKGEASETLLDSYSQERVFAARENIRHSSKSAEFMAPPSPAFKIMRSAVLALAEHHAWVRTLINPRQSTAIGFPQSPLNDPGSDFGEAGPRLGETPSDLPLRPQDSPNETVVYLSSLLGSHFTLVVHADTDETASSEALRDIIARHGEGLKVVVVSPTRLRSTAARTFLDGNGLAATRLGLRNGSAMLVRPDGHVLARWDSLQPNKISSAIERCYQGGAK